MHLFKPTVCAAALAAGLLLPAIRVSAQDDAPAPKGTPSVSAPSAPSAPEGGGGGGGDRMEQFRKSMNERLKTALKASDDEWSVIEPLLTKLQDKQRDVMMSRFRGMMGRGGPGGGGEGGRRRGPGGDNNNNGDKPKPEGAGQGEGGRRREGPPESAGAQALQAALQDDNTSVTDIKTKLAAVRTERTKANADLESARAELKKVLNMRQEAVLVLAGMME